MFSESKWITFQISHRQNPESSPSRPGSWSHHSQLQDNSFSAISYYLCCDTHYGWYLFVEEHHTMLAGNSSTQYALAKVQKLCSRSRSAPLLQLLSLVFCHANWVIQSIQLQTSFKAEFTGEKIQNDAVNIFCHKKFVQQICGYFLKKVQTIAAEKVTRRENI